MERTRTCADVEGMHFLEPPTWSWELFSLEVVLLVVRAVK